MWVTLMSSFLRMRQWHKVVCLRRSQDFQKKMGDVYWQEAQKATVDVRDGDDCHHEKAGKEGIKLVTATSMWDQMSKAPHGETIVSVLKDRLKAFALDGTFGLTRGHSRSRCSRGR